MTGSGDRSAPLPPVPSSFVAFAPLLDDNAFVDDLIVRLTDSLRGELPELIDDPELGTSLVAAARASVYAVRATLSGTLVEFVLPPEAIALARTLARRGIGVDSSLVAFRTVRQTSLHRLNELTAALVPGDEEPVPFMLQVSSYLLWWIDTAQQALLTELTRERDLLMQGNLARSIDLVQQILTGHIIDIDEGSRVLGYPLRRHHTAVVGWIVDETLAPAAVRRSLLAAGTELARQFDGQLLLVPSGTHSSWAWFATTREPDLDHLRAQVDLPDGVGIAIGNTGYGLAGFRRSHDEAVVAHRIARSAERAALIAYDDVELAGLISTDPEGMRALVSRELRGLAEDDPGVDKIRTTVLAFFSANQHLPTTAERLGVHKNTVRYRLRQAEDLLRHPLDERRAKVEMALICLEVFGHDHVLGAGARRTP